MSYYLRVFSTLKWKGKFVCRNCKSKIYYELSDFSRKCANCKRKESLTASTALHGLKIDMDIVLQVFVSIQDKWQKAYYGWETSRQGLVQPRPSNKDIASLYDIEAKQVWRLINAVTSWLPPVFHKPNKKVDEMWFRGVKKENRPRYYALYKLLFDGNSPRREEEILYILIHKKIARNLNSYDL